MREEFSCLQEQGTVGLEEDPIDRKTKVGRIDLIVRTDNSIIGIENKLDAAFTDGQPDKYMATLRQQSNDHKKKRAVLCILAPKIRRDEIKNKIDISQYKNQYVLLSWEDLLENIRNKSPENLDRLSRVAIDQLDAYIQNYVSFWPAKVLTNHLKGVFDPSDAQGVFIRKLRNAIEGETGIGTGARGKTTGYHVDLKRRAGQQHQSERAWLGFISKDSITQGAEDNLSELIIVTSFPCSTNLGHEFREVKLRQDSWWRDRPIYAWAINFTDEWNRPEIWKEKLQWLWNPLEQTSLS